MEQSRPATIRVQVAPRPQRPFPDRCGVMTMGVLQVLFGVLCFLFHTVAIITSASMSNTGHGQWAGSFYILAGSFGVAAARSKSRCLLVPFLVFSIMAALLVVPAIVLSSVGLQRDLKIHCGYCSSMVARRAMNGLVIALSLCQGIVALTSSIFCCGLLCTCNNNTDENTQVHVRTDHSTGQRSIVLTIPQAQLLQLSQQPVATQAMPLAVNMRGPPVAVNMPAPPVAVNMPAPPAGATGQQPPAYDNYTTTTSPPNYQQKY